jgi:hypothetical protein
MSLPFIIIVDRARVVYEDLKDLSTGAHVHRVESTTNARAMSYFQIVCNFSKKKKKK